MSREILFKAKRKNWQELLKEEWWVEGFYSKLPAPSLREILLTDDELYAESAKDYIIVNKRKQHSNSKLFPFPAIESECFEIDPETLCQYTGMTDKKGKRIWENDVLTEKHRGRIHYVFKVVWDMEEGSWMLESKYGSLYGIGLVNQSKFEKESNIFDNPELLGGA